MNKKYSKKTKEMVLGKYQCGERIAVIAEEFEISKTTIYRWIREHDNNLPKRNKKVDMKTFHELERMYQRQKKIIQILQSSPCLVNSPLDIKIETIDKMVSDEFTINTLCEALCVPKGTYYNRKLRGKHGYTEAMRKRDEIKPIIKEIYDASNQIYGPGKVHAILKDRGYTVSINVVASIMHDNNWFSIRGGAKALYKSILKEKKTYLNNSLL